MNRFAQICAAVTRASLPIILGLISGCCCNDCDERTVCAPPPTKPRNKPDAASAIKPDAPVEEKHEISPEAQQMWQEIDELKSRAANSEPVHLRIPRSGEPLDLDYPDFSF
jgi:hypothetical protein